MCDPTERGASWHDPDAAVTSRKATLLGPNFSLNSDASPAALRAVRSAPVSFVR